jgi:nitroreductase
LLGAAYGQSQVVDASHLIVFANETNINDETIEKYITRIGDTRNIPVESLTGFGNYMKGAINHLTEDAKNIWASKQTYLALGNLLNAAAELKIDVTPMEGFVPAQVNEILGLNALGLNASLMATVGYRHTEDATQHLKKVRKSNEELFITL